MSEPVPGYGDHRKIVGKWWYQVSGWIAMGNFDTKEEASHHGRTFMERTCAGNPYAWCEVGEWVNVPAQGVTLHKFKKEDANAKSR